MNKMNKGDIAMAVQEELGGSNAEATRAVDAVFAKISDEVSKGNEVAVAGFGSFQKVERKARQGRNPMTGETIKIKAKGAVKFKVSKQFKDAVA